MPAEPGLAEQGGGVAQRDREEHRWRRQRLDPLACHHLDAEPAGVEPQPFASRPAAKVTVDGRGAATQAQDRGEGRLRRRAPAVALAISKEPAYKPAGALPEGFRPAPAVRWIATVAANPARPTTTRATATGRRFALGEATGWLKPRTCERRCPGVAARTTAITSV
jgi:hypothetical protein